MNSRPSLDPKKIRPIGTYLSDITKELQERGKEPKLPILSLPNFNSKLWGLKEGLTVLGGRTSQGKSSLALQIAQDMALQNIPVLFLSLEMTVESLIERIFCNQERVDSFNLIRGHYNIDTEIQDKWKSFQNMIKDIPLLLTCGVGKNFNEIKEIITRLEPCPKVVIVDYIQAIAMMGSNTSREMMNEYIRLFRQLALEREFAGILCSQINRGAEDGRGSMPRLSQLKETGVLEEHADTVLLLHYPRFYDQNVENPNDFTIIIAKQRNGLTGAVKLQYYPENYRFSEVGKEVPIETNIDELQKAKDFFGGTVYREGE